MKQRTPDAPSRRQKLRRHIRDAYTVTIGSKHDTKRDAMLLYLGTIGITFSIGVLYWTELASDGTTSGVVRLLALTFIVSPAFTFALLGSLLLIFAISEYIIDESTPGRRQRRRLRSMLHELRSFVKAPIDDRLDLRDQRVTWRRNATDASMHQSGLRVRLLARRVDRHRQRFVEHVQAIYDGSFDRVVGEFLADNSNASKSALDQTASVWTSLPSVRTLAATRVLEGYAPLLGNIAFERRLDPGTSLVFSPRWVYDMVEFFESRTPTSLGEHMRMPGDRRSMFANPRQCVPLNSADPETVLRLYEPQGQGPFSDLGEVVQAALIV